MGAKTSGGPVFFNVNVPKRINSDWQAEYEQVVESNKDLLIKLEAAILRYVHAGDCDSLRLLLKATSYLYQSAEQIIIDQKICESCTDIKCSAVGKGLKSVETTTGERI